MNKDIIMDESKRDCLSRKHVNEVTNMCINMSMLATIDLVIPTQRKPV